MSRKKIFLFCFLLLLSILFWYIFCFQIPLRSRQPISHGDGLIMGKLVVILAFVCPVLCYAQNSSFTVDDLLNLSSLSPKNFDSYLEKKGFSIKRRSLRDEQMGYSFFENKKI